MVMFFIFFSINVQYFRDRIDYDADLNRSDSAFDFHHDDASTFGVINRFHSEPQPQIHHRNHLAAEVNDPFDKFGYLEDCGDRHHPDDLLDLQNTDIVLFFSQREGEVFPLPYNYQKIR